jgi:hypothetical protein
MHNVIIRMGAAHYDCRIRTPKGLVHFDLRAMDKEGRRTFHREFMNSYREATGVSSQPKRRKRVSNRNTGGMQ